MSAAGDEARRRRRGRLVVAALFVLFFAPVLTALWLNTGGAGLVPFARVNHGELLEPAVAVTFDETFVPGSAAIPRDEWLLVLVSGGACGEGCGRALWSTRRARLGLGHDASRVRRVLVLPPGAAGPAPALAGEHSDLVVVHAGAGWRGLLPRAPGAGDPPSIYLVDPRRYAVLRYAADAPAANMIDDLERLLRISTIG